MAAPEIIDLTIHSSNYEDKPLSTSNLDSSHEPRRSRKKRSRKSSSNSSPLVTASQSRSNSLERKSDTDKRIKRKRSDSHEENGEEQSLKHYRKDSNTGTTDDFEIQDLFYVDLTGAPIPLRTSELPVRSDAKDDLPGKLLVPAHVTVLGSTPVEIVAPSSLAGSDDDDFINYLDYDDAKDALRYYQEPPDEAAVLNRTVCKNCGAEGEHKTSACPVQICLTCGARDEHSTRSCPISKVCFTCGMKGHINANCPNRRSARALMSTREEECDRCSASSHKTNECPTWWRLYEYLSGEDQTKTLALRQSKKDMKLGQGGEGFVADDEWCYYCGGCGHWGDECDGITSGRSAEEHSAFSVANVMTGPFYDPDAKPKASTSRSHVRDWEHVDRLADIDGVGRQGRMKSRAALEKQARQVEDDPDDWFGRASNRTRSNEISHRPSAPGQSKKLTFGKSIGGGRQHAAQDIRGPPSLLSRLGLGDHPQIDSHSNPRSEKRDYRTDPTTRSRNRDGRHQQREERFSNRYTDGQRHSQTGPRYKGGYGR